MSGLLLSGKIKTALGGCFIGARKITYKVYYVDFK